MTEFCNGGFRGVDERRPHRGGQSALEGECGFDWSGVGFDEQVFKELIEALVYRAGGNEIVG